MNKVMNCVVTDKLTVAIIPNAEHEFLMSTKEVATGYGTTDYAIRKSFDRHESELIEGKHFIKGCDIMSNPLKEGVNMQPHQIFWTKRGIVRLGFFIKSERARLFRDWAENLILQLDEQMDLFGAVSPVKQLKSRNHNRLTQQRLVDILAEVCKIEDTQLRMSIANKLTTV